MRTIGGPWSAVSPDDAASYARERARSTGQPRRVVDGLRGPLRGPGPLPAGVRVVMEYGT